MAGRGGSWLVLPPTRGSKGEHNPGVRSLLPSPCCLGGGQGLQPTRSSLSSRAREGASLVPRDPRDHPPRAPPAPPAPPAPGPARSQLKNGVVPALGKGAAASGDAGEGASLLLMGVTVITAYSTPPRKTASSASETPKGASLSQSSLASRLKLRRNLMPSRPPGRTPGGSERSAQPPSLPATGSALAG